MTHQAAEIIYLKIIAFTYSKIKNICIWYLVLLTLIPFSVQYCPLVERISKKLIFLVNSIIVDNILLFA